MRNIRRVTDAAHLYINELTHRVVAGSGIPSDRFHLGKIILQSLKDAPDFCMQIDGATGESETNVSALKRTIRCAVSLKNIGLKRKDVMVIMAPNHIDVAIPFYAALYHGIAIAPVDRTMAIDDLQKTFSVIRPSIVFCQNERLSDVQKTLNNLHLKCHIVTFDKEVLNQNFSSFTDFMDKYGDDVPAENFKPTDFDPDDTFCFLLSTSGTTGFPKAIASTHKNHAITMAYNWSRNTKFPTPTRLTMISAPLQWLSAAATFLVSPVVRCMRLQSSWRIADDHAFFLINKYKPTNIFFSSTIMYSLMNSDKRKHCDFSSIETAYFGGSHVSQEFVDEIKAVLTQAEVLNVYGNTELCTMGFVGDNPPPGSCGKPIGCLQYRLIDIDTQQDINKPLVPGELWVKGPVIFKEYYNDAIQTAQAFSEDGWFKTGDMFYRDQNWYFYFVERIKLLMGYNDNKISPVEIEEVIRQHPGVLDVAVTGIPDPKCGELPAACVVIRNNYEVTAQEIENLVKESLSELKQLRGGVIFLKELPMTASSKVHRRKLKQIVLQMKKEDKNTML